MAPPAAAKTASPSPPRKSRADMEAEEREATLREERDARRMDKDYTLDLAARIRSGGNALEQLTRWAEDVAHYKED